MGFWPVEANAVVAGRQRALQKAPEEDDRDREANKQACMMQHKSTTGVLIQPDGNARLHKIWGILCGLCI